MYNPTIRISSSEDAFMSDVENIHVASWTKDKTYDSFVMNVKSEAKHSQLLTYNVVVRKLKYGEKNFKEYIVNNYQKPQALINYLIDIFFFKGDWVLYFFSGSSNISYITYETIVINIYLYYIFFKFMFHYAM